MLIRVVSLKTLFRHCLMRAGLRDERLFSFIHEDDYGFVIMFYDDPITHPFQRFSLKDSQLHSAKTHFITEFKYSPSIFFHFHSYMYLIIILIA